MKQIETERQRHPIYVAVLKHEWLKIVAHFGHDICGYEVTTKLFNADTQSVSCRISYIPVERDITFKKSLFKYK